MASDLVELRLPRFKSLRDSTVALGGLSVLVGKNGSGKSNVLDGLAVLSALATGAELRDALDGGRYGPVVRGGSEGCAPIGEDSFEIGATTSVDGRAYHLDVEVVVAPVPQIRSERLWTTRLSGPRKGEQQELLATELADPGSSDIVARWDNQKRGLNPPVTFRASQLLTAQIPTRVPATSQAGRTIHEVASSVLESLMSVFILDPVPHQMREYVPERDDQLRRSAENLSAVLHRLMGVEETRRPLLEMTRSLSEAQVSDLGTVASELGDVMVVLYEQIGRSIVPMPARLMSDGTLRFLAIASALLDRPLGSSDSRDRHAPSRLLVVEELENGLHPSQAALLVQRLKQSAEDHRVRTLATTHSPAILDSLDGADHEDVLVCSRRGDGWSTITRLTDFPDYFDVVGRGSLGFAATTDRLRPGTNARSGTPSLVEVLGLD